MSDDGRTPWRRRSALLLVGVALVLAGCSIVSGVIHTENDLRNAGYGNPDIKFTSVGAASAVNVSVTPSSNSVAGGRSLGEQADTVAQIVWDDLPGRFAVLSVAVAGLGAQTYTHSQLVSQFGARPGNLDAQSVSGEIGDVARNIAIAVAVVLVVVVGVVVTVLLVTRRRRQRRQVEYEQLLVSTLPPEMWGYVAPQYGVPTPGGAVPPGAPAFPAPGPPPPGSPPQAGWPPPQAGWPPPQAGWPPPQPGFGPQAPHESQVAGEPPPPGASPAPGSPPPP